MKKFLRQRGQAAVEFTLLLPFFAMVLFATIYIGMFVLDYVTLDNAAARAARAASRNSDEGYIIPGEIETKIKELYPNLFFSWYTPDAASPTSKRYQSDGVTEANNIADAEYVQVTIKTTLDSTKSEKSLLAGILPSGYTISKTVKLEKTESEP